MKIVVYTIIYSKNVDSKKRFLAKIYFIYLWEYTISYKISSQSDKNRKSSTWSTRSHSADNHDIWLSIGNPNIEGAMGGGLLLFLVDHVELFLFLLLCDDILYEIVYSHK